MPKKDSSALPDKEEKENKSGLRSFLESKFFLIIRFCFLVMNLTVIALYEAPQVRLNTHLCQIRGLITSIL
jgi:hypothetical protein